MFKSTVFYQYLLFVLTWICYGYKVSEKEVSWDKINTACQQPFRSKLFTPKANDELRRSLPLNEKFWVQAKAKPTNYLYWRGCHRPTKQLTTLEPRLLTNNSVVSCIQNTSCIPHYVLALKGDTCICLEFDEVPQYFRLYPSAVDQFCTGNLNDECGCPNGAFSLYQITSDTNKGGDCITQTLRVSIFRRRQSGLRRCDDRNVIDSYRCWDGRSVRFFRHPVNLTWYEARRRCWQKGFELAVGSGRSTNTFIGKEFWTEMRRTFSLTWTTKQGGDEKACVTVSKDDHEMLQLTEENCSSNYKALCEQTDYSSRSSGFPVSAVVIPVLIVLVVVVVVLLIVIFERRQKLRRKLLRSVNNRFYDQVVCSSVQTPSRGQTDVTQTATIVEEENIYHTIDDQREQENQSAEITYAVPYRGQTTVTSNAPTNQYYNEAALKERMESEIEISNRKDKLSEAEIQDPSIKANEFENQNSSAAIRTDFRNFENHYDVTLVT